MNTPGDPLSDETRLKLKVVSKLLLNLHGSLLASGKTEYEATIGTIANANHYLQLVIDHPHFSWLRKLSSLIALLDEATSRMRPATEPDAQALLRETALVLNFGDADEEFNNKFRLGLAANAQASTLHQAALKSLGG
jgi:hypothetical protein